MSCDWKKAFCRDGGIECLVMEKRLSVVRTGSRVSCDEKRLSVVRTGLSVL